MSVLHQGRVKMKGTAIVLIHVGRQLIKLDFILFEILFEIYSYSRIKPTFYSLFFILIRWYTLFVFEHKTNTIFPYSTVHCFFDYTMWYGKELASVATYVKNWQLTNNNFDISILTYEIKRVLGYIM